jgi:hypothetical protein
LTGLVTPEPPLFLMGPVAPLLTNTLGFSARVTFTSAGGGKGPVSGELLGRGNWLLYAPGQEEKSETKAPAGGFSFLWDVAEHRGFVLSETLQGYAPVSAKTTPTNWVAVPVQAPPERLDGHPCRLEEALVQMSNGSNAVFRVWRAGDLRQFPARLTSLVADEPLTLNFSRIRLAVPPPELFAPPASFTQYPSPAVLVDELAIRDRNARRKPEP